MQGLIPAHQNTMQSPGRFAQLFSAGTVEQSPSDAKSQRSQSVWSAPSTAHDKSATPQHRRSGLLSQISMLSSEKEELRAQLEASQKEVLKFQADFQAAGREGADAAAKAVAEAASLRKQVLVTSMTRTAWSELVLGESASPMGVLMVCMAMGLFRSRAVRAITSIV